MPNTKHTPGPWRACRDGKCDCGYVYGPPVAEAGGETPVVAIVCGPTHLSCADLVPEREQQAANIRLIAAAPDLLEACELALKALTDSENASLTLGAYALVALAQEKLRAAISKAKGESVDASYS